MVQELSFCGGGGGGGSGGDGDGDGDGGISCWGSSQNAVRGFSDSKGFFGKRNSVSLFDGFEVDSKRIKMLGPHENQPQGEGPLGLSLRKSQSFADLIETTLSKKKEDAARIDNQDSERARRRKKEGDKWKAGNWNAKLLRIGTWERRAARDLDLVAKCYYAKKKLVWEMLDDGLKSKMEIQWSDITAIRAAFPKNNNAVLEIELKSAPLFFRETNPQPRKHTNWQASVDFTGGQAPRYRRHHIQFEEGTLLPHFEKLLECDKRLRMLSQQPFPLSRSPYFNLNMSEYSFEFNRPRADYAPMLQFSQYGIQRPGYSYVPSHAAAQRPSHQAQILQAAAQRPNITAYTDLASPMSVIEFPPVEDPRGNYNIELLQRNLNMIRGGTIHGDQTQQYRFSTPPSQVTPLIVQPLTVHYPSPSGNRLTRPPSTNTLLKDISNQLLHAPVTATCTDEHKLMARVKSMCNLLELSQEPAPVINTNTTDIEYSHSPNHSASSSWNTNTGESKSNGGFVPQEPVDWLPVIGANENSLLYHQRIPSFSNVFFEQALQDFAAANGMNNLE